MTYYYLHQNGSIIKKPDYVVETNTNPEEYFDSPLVVKWWYQIDIEQCKECGQLMFENYGDTKEMFCLKCLEKVSTQRETP